MTKNLDIIKAHYAASDRKDIAGMMANVSATAEWTEMAGFPCAGTWIGPQAIIENVFKVLGESWEDYGFHLDYLIDGNDVIVGIGTYTAKFRKTGKDMRARVAHVWHLQGGQVVRFEQFTDTLLVANAMR